MGLARIDRAVEVVLRGRLSPFRRWPDMVMACMILTFVSLLGMWEPAKYLTPNSIFTGVHDSQRVLVGGCLALAILVALQYPLAGGLMCVGTGGFLRLYDAIHQRAIVGEAIYAWIVLVALLRIYARWRKDDEMRDVIAQARELSREITSEHVRHERALCGMRDGGGDAPEGLSTARDERQDRREERQDRREGRLDKRETAVDARDDAGDEQGGTP